MRALTWHNGARVSVDHGEDDSAVEAAANQIADLSSKAAGLVDTIATLQDALERQRLELERTRALVPPKAPIRIFDRGFVRFDADKTLWLLGKRETGWASFGFRLDSWDDLFRRYDVRVVECGADEHGSWWAVENAS
jgi:hypothetical protein